MFISSRLIVAASAIALLAGCASPNPYDNQGQASTGMSKMPSMAGWARWPVQWRGLPLTTTTVARAH